MCQSTETRSQCSISKLLEQNRTWAESIRAQDPQYFQRLSAQQSPEFLWIGCSDSRVPANQITGLQPGEVFVHRNVANIVHNNDLNLLSVIQFAVDVLQVKHIMVVGHYGCGGVKAAISNKEFGLVDYWIHDIRNIYQIHREELETLAQEDLMVDRLCELNVIAQVANVCRTKMVQRAWRRGQDLSIHGWFYGLKDGLLMDLGVSVLGRCACGVSHGYPFSST